MAEADGQGSHLSEDLDRRRLRWKSKGSFAKIACGLESLVKKRRIPTQINATKALHWPTIDETFRMFVACELHKSKRNEAVSS
ncbi:hypothetical protein [Paraburkholderia bannensis]|uniref:hypothetical protein n=1 Tax=Paraburkholderia bannensis TaxID=765414 RepID=UPI0012EB9C38|nr:hypothetical protein [Paraburkholderia bannensis]